MKLKIKKYDYSNSKALYVLKIVTMSFAILACVVVMTAMLTRWIMDLNQKIKESSTKVAKAAARLNKFRKSRIKHILKQRKLQLKEEKKGKKFKYKNKPVTECGCEDAPLEEVTGDENAINDFDNELSVLMFENDGEDKITGK